MKKYIIITIFLMLAPKTYAYGDWVNMRNTGNQSIDLSYTRCFYKQELFGKFSISITIKGSSFSCPYSIKYNPVTGKWKR